MGRKKKNAYSIKKKKPKNKTAPCTQQKPEVFSAEKSLAGRRGWWHKPQLSLGVWWCMGEKSTCDAEDLGQQDPPEEEMTTHSNIPPWRIPWTEEPGGLWSTGSQSQHNWTHTHPNTKHRIRITRYLGVI